MNRKHLLWHVFNSLEPYYIRDMIDALEHNKVTFSENPQAGEISVAKAIRDKYDEYEKSVKND